MHSIRRSLAGFSLLGVILLAGASSPAQADSPGPYYATPSWDQTLPAATRFIVLSNFASAAVLDRNTGLVWEKSPSMTTQNWVLSRYFCLNKNVGGQKGWRLPSIPELASLVDPTTSNPALPIGHPFVNIPAGFILYWSATVIPDASTVWGVHFDDGTVDAFVKTDSDIHFWCVRGGMNADAY